MALMKICRCGKKISYSLKLCDECQAKQKDYQKDYDKSIRYTRDKKYNEFYKSREWLVARQAALVRDKFLCQLCLKENIITPYNTVHHLKPIKTIEGWQDRLKVDSLMCVCEAHHKELHIELEKKIYGEGVSRKF